MSVKLCLESYWKLQFSDFQLNKLRKRLKHHINDGYPTVNLLFMLQACSYTTD